MHAKIEGLGPMLASNIGKCIDVPSSPCFFQRAAAMLKREGPIVYSVAQRTCLVVVAKKRKPIAWKKKEKSPIYIVRKGEFALRNECER